MKAEKTSIDQARDTGLALVLLLLLIARVWRPSEMIVAAICVLLLTMLWPGVFHHPARLWFGLADLLGTLSSKLLLTLVFVLVLVPVAGLRRLAGADPMQRRRWKRDRDSVFVTRDHDFSADDLKNPY